MAQTNPCSIGQLVKTPCHQTTYVSQKRLKLFEELSDADKEILCFRTGIMEPSSIVTLCFHHEYYYMTKFEEQQKSCCNPFQTHKKPVRKSLRVVSLALAKELMQKLVNVKPGQKICCNCRNRGIALGMSSEAGPSNKATQHGSESISDSDLDVLEESLSNVQTMEEINTSICNIGCSPLKLHSVPQHSRSSYGKRKVKQIQSIIKHKVARALQQDISSSENESTEVNIAQQKARDLDELVALMQEKLPVLNRQKKIQMLTMVPPSWSQKMIMETFNVSEYLVRQSKKLVLQKGIMSLPDPRKGKKMSSDVLQLIQSFYEDDTTSRQMPGKKDCISIRRNEHVQKRLILCNLKELYSSFKKQYPDVKVGFSKFCSLRPKWCVLAGAAGTHCVCVCSIHQNVILLLNAAQLKDSYTSLIGYIVCDLKDRNCMLRHCKNCPNSDNLENFLKSKFKEYDEDDTIEYSQWVSTGRTELIKLTSTMGDFMQTIVSKIEKLIPHAYIAKEQSKFLKELKETLASDTAVVLMDFSENYSFFMQDEAQGYHWTSEACTVHPVVIYVRSATQSLEISSLCFLSDDLNHDVCMVYRIQEIAMQFIKNKYSDIVKIHYFTDGCASQYKNRKNFLNLCHHKNDFGLSASWSFFATSHGKSPCDGIGGTVKRIVSRASLQRYVTNQITKPMDVFNFCVVNIKNIQFYFISSFEMKNVRNNLKERFLKASLIPGTRSFHYFCPQSSRKIAMKRLSKDDKYSLIFTFKDESDNKFTTWTQLHIQCYVACIYDESWFFGMVCDIEEEEGDVKIKFMHPQGPALSFYWPVPDDICYIPLQHILCTVQPPMTTTTGRTYYFLEDDMKAVQIKWSATQKGSS